MKRKKGLFLTTITALLIGCSSNVEPLPQNGNSSVPGGGSGSGSGNGNTPVGNASWLIPQSEVFDGGPGKDGIPALLNPKTAPVSNINFISDNDLVIGFKVGEEARAYPHAILDWHEIINDKVNVAEIAITYCPLTGTGIGWNRFLQNKSSTFGVSGLLYNTNLIPYDRGTNSNWSQIGLQCVNGDLIGEEIETYQVVETTWSTWKLLYPNSTVVTENTGFSRNYSTYPYGDYKTNNTRFIFPVKPQDDRLPAKERVLGVIINNKAKIYRFDDFDNGTGLVVDTFEGEEILVLGNKSRNFLIAYKNNLKGEKLLFQVVTSFGEAMFTDLEGSEWNVFGEAISGPRKGEKLQRVTNFVGYWFSFGAFYPGAEIYNGDN